MKYVILNELVYKIISEQSDIILYTVNRVYHTNFNYTQYEQNYTFTVHDFKLNCKVLSANSDMEIYIFNWENTARLSKMATRLLNSDDSLVLNETLDRLPAKIQSSIWHSHHLHMGDKHSDILLREGLADNLDMIFANYYSGNILTIYLDDFTYGTFLNRNPLIEIINNSFANILTDCEEHLTSLNIDIVKSISNESVNKNLITKKILE